MQTEDNVAVTDLLSKQHSIVGESKRSRHRHQRKEWLVGYLFILPAIIGFVVFVLYPLITTFYYALTKWNGITAPEFIGLKNFVRLFTNDPSFFRHCGLRRSLLCLVYHRRLSLVCCWRCC